MLQTTSSPNPKFQMGIFASAFAHVIIVALLVLELPESKLEPDEPPSIQVELETPDEEKAQEQQQESGAEGQEAKGEEITSAGQPKVPSPQILRPVYMFGEKDSGPEKSVDGDAAGETKTASQTPAEKPPDKPETPEKVDNLPDTPDRVAAQAPVQEPSEPEVDANNLRSRHDSGSQVATTAIGEVPRGIRAGELCVTELRRQLLNSVPAFSPDLLPTYRLDEGTVLQVRKGAFRANALWYNLKFRCEIDEAATRVMDFGFDVGEAIPRAEWKSRGFPSM